MFRCSGLFWITGVGVVIIVASSFGFVEGLLSAFCFMSGMLVMYNLQLEEKSK